MADNEMKKWRIPNVEENVLAKLKNELHTDDIIARLLYNRNIKSVEAARAFLYADVDDLHSPYLLKDMDKAVKHILKCIEDNNRIVIYGDYDVDGITSTSLLYRCLKKIDANVDYYIPERQTEGYGLNKDALEYLVNEGTSLVITVDCGISSAELIDEMKSKVDIIVTDHHTAPQVVPNTIAVVNPKQLDCSYPDKNLAGVGVAFKLCQALWETKYNEIYFDDLDIVALGTVADLVPLQGENRILVRKGLEKINNTPNLGLRELIIAAGYEDRNITAGHIGFTLAPRLNAAGRVTHAMEGVKLLVSTDKKEARYIAEALQETNLERQQIERNILQVANDVVAAQGEEAEYVLVVAGEGWHQGVVGIVASRLVETFYKPALVISINDGIGKGSCRSIEAFDMYKALNSVEDLLIQYGGHKQAAGFSIKAENIPILQKRLVEYCKANLTKEDYIPVVDIDLEINPIDITVETVEKLKYLEPYGMKNSTPVFALKNIKVDSVYCMGQTKQHIKFSLDINGNKIEAISWFGAEYQKRIFPNHFAKLAFTMGINEWNNECNVQLNIQDIQINDLGEIVLTPEKLRKMYIEIQRLFSWGAVPEYKLLTEMLRRCSKNYNPKELMIALEIFKELGIIEVTQQDGGMIIYRWCQVKQKLELLTSITFLKYSS